jgi:hypothetical protein
MRFTRILILASLLALVVVPAALALRFTDESYNLPTGVTGQNYSHKFDGAGGCGPALPYQYRLLGSTLPAGLTLDKSGLLHGVPQVSGRYTFWVELSDQNPPEAPWCVPVTAEREFTINIIPGLNIQQNSLDPRITFTSAPYSFQLTASGGTPTWSIQSGSLPAGITLGSNGLLSGTPTAEGDFTFVVKATDGGRSDTETYTLTVVQRLQIAKSAAPTAEVGLRFTLVPKASGGRPALSWSLAGGTLPTGLTLDPATGTITGTPGAAGSFALKLAVTDQLGLTATEDVTLKVAARLAIAKKALKVAKVGSLYKARFAAIGGVLPRQWNILGGRPGLLPAGIKLNRKTGELSGTPTKAGTYRLRMQVVDKLGARSSLGFVLKVAA